MGPPRIFISYCHQDEHWKDRLLAHLEVLQMQDMLSLWVDTDIGAGEDWRAKIEEAIDAASIAILLISADFLRSKFIMGDEVPRIMTRRENVRDCMQKSEIRISIFLTIAFAIM